MPDQVLVTPRISKMGGNLPHGLDWFLNNTQAGVSKDCWGSANVEIGVFERY